MWWATAGKERDDLPNTRWLQWTRIELAKLGVSDVGYLQDGYWPDKDVRTWIKTFVVIRQEQREGMLIEKANSSQDQRRPPAYLRRCLGGRAGGGRLGRLALDHSPTPAVEAQG